MGKRPEAAVGVSDHAGWAVLMTATSDGAVLDRRRIALVDDGLPVMPYHHDAQGLPLADAVALVERVRLSAERCAQRALEVLAAERPRACAIALRACPTLPATVAERLADVRSQNVADWVVYRQALAKAATERAWRVHWYDAKTVLAEGARALGVPSLEPLLQQTGKALGPPWQKDHQLALAAALGALPLSRRT